MMRYIKNLVKIIIPKQFHQAIRARLEKLVFPSATYNQDGLISIHNCDFMSEPKFQEAYAAGYQTGSWGKGIHWRTFVICWAAQACKSKEGDFIECGVNRGGFSMAILKYTNLDSTQKNFYLLDTFNGLVDEQISEEERINGVHSLGYEDVWSEVQERFKKYEPTVKLIRGAVPETLNQVGADKVSFLSIDMNCAEPEIAAAEYFWEKLVPGAIIVLDDYGWPGRAVQKMAFDKFAYDRGVEVLGLPTGQGLIIKP